jgi:hypothetical protein
LEGKNILDKKMLLTNLTKTSVGCRGDTKIILRLADGYMNK